MNDRSRSGNQTGFTLVEIMVAVFVLAILAAVAIPSFQATIRSNRQATLTNELMESFALARSEAIKRGKRVTLCRSETTGQDASTCATGGSDGWEQGWLLFTDGDTKGTVDGGDTRIRVWQGPDYDASITGDSSLANYVSLMPTGLASTGGTFTITVDGETQYLIVGVSGHVRICKEESADDC